MSLDRGADEGVPRPRDWKVVEQRLAMPLRMRGQRELRRFHGVQRDLGFRSAELAGVPLAVALVEFALLAVLARTPGWPRRRAVLLA